MPYVCPWWGGYFIDNPIRHLLHNPDKIVGPYVRAGMTVIDVGCGMGLFSIAMAKLVGDQGRVIAVDLQRKMLDVLGKRAERAGVADRIQRHKCDQDRLGVDAQADFALAFMMVHEVPDQRRLLGEIMACLKPGGKLLVAEPKIHVPGKAFGQTVALATEVGLRTFEEPMVRWCRAVVLEKRYSPIGEKSYTDYSRHQ
ncbi:MAG: class I SAM-dependent methyltransferase [Pirellulales bacterium]